MTTLCAHVATLAQPNQIRSLIRLFICSKLPKRSNVVNRQALPNILPTLGASPLLGSDNERPSIFPSTSAVRLRATNPELRILARLIPMTVLTSASWGTVLPRPSIAAYLPRLAQEFLAAVDADGGDIGNPLGIVGTRSRSWLKTPRVRPVSVRHVSGISNAEALEGTESRPADINLALVPTKYLAACFTDTVNLMTLARKPTFAAGRTISVARVSTVRAGKFHSRSIPPFAGSGRTLEVAKALGRKSIGIELNREYIDTLIIPKCQQQAMFMEASA